MAKNSTDSEKRLVEPSIGDLIDRLTIGQIKEALDPVNHDSYCWEMKKIEDDLDVIIGRGELTIDARFVRLLIALAQINLHIWHAKERMQTMPGRYEDEMKLAHQLNGIRNQLKNRLARRGADDKRSTKGNLGTDDLTGWQLSVLISEP